MKRITFNVLFISKQSRVDKNGKTPVFLRVTVNGLRSEVSVMVIKRFV